ncbi:hypothetical protein [Catellatospora tritici]|uniref:hypothetical protein n=1 Tax=Catellatospora tritici TaxID=2851566 RepID=UPI001C2DBCBE|nr:hypothetical protein [Catellatospora tritici]MBV1854262.1 hypothetical protein [Catellatospora tritici]
MAGHSPERDFIAPVPESDLERAQEDTEREHERHREDTERLTDDDPRDPRNPSQPFSGSEH